MANNSGEAMSDFVKTLLYIKPVALMASHQRPFALFMPVGPWQQGWTG
jgi:hypothetical protein